VEFCFAPKLSFGRFAGTFFFADGLFFEAPERKFRGEEEWS
jgi:hypothetical protein